MRKILNLIGYEKPTEIQELAEKPIMEGKDTLVIAPTGFGKTLAVVIPVFKKILEDKKRINALYITPLRALNRDVFKRIINLGTKLGIDVDIRHGDTPNKTRRIQSFDPPNMLITTPETLQAIMVGKKLKEHLKNVRYVIIDEIHEICESKRGSQLSVGLERLKEIAGDFQRIGLSATVENPKEVAEFLTSKDCKIVNAGKKKKYEIKVEYYNKVKKSLDRIKEIIEKSKSCLIFTNTRETAEALGSRLKEEGISAEVHHSSLSKSVRVKIENKFKNGEIKVIVATSSLELGIDVGSVDVVIQYGSPRQVTRLIQRVGRSGHFVTRVSKGYIICNDKEEYTEALAIKELFEKGWMEKINIVENPLDVLAHQIVGICVDKGKTSQTEIYKIIKRSYPFRNLNFSKFKEVINFLKRIRLVGGEKEIYRTRRGLMYYFNNLSVIPDEKNYLVIDKEENKRIGILHEGFVSEHVYENSSFIMKGEPWKVVEIDRNKIYVVRSGEVDVDVPVWEGENIPVSKEVSKSCCEIKKKVFEEQKEFGYPDCKNIIVEESSDVIIIHSCFGSKINETIGKLIGALISSETGENVKIRSDAYRIMIKYRYNYEKIESLIKEIKPDWVLDIIKSSIKNSQLFEHRFIHVGRRFGVIRKDAEYSHGIISRMIKIYSNTPVVEETINEILHEKMDIKGTKEVFESIQNGKIKISGTFNYEFSPLALEGINISLSVVKPREEEEIIRLVDERLRKKRFFFICMKCGNIIGELTTENIEDLKCNKCGARLIGFVPIKEKELAKKAVKKYLSNKPLDKDERNMIKKLKQTAELFLSYGKKGVYVMGGFGIGVKTAKRILSKYHKDKRSLIKDIIKEERNFIANRKFWST